MSFVNPLFMWGALGIAVPIIIHLLNRRRYHVVDWAAMEFLLEAYRERKRRVQLEHLLLLLLRILAVILLTMVIARPFFKAGMLTDALTSGGTERILLIDDSASMQAEHDGKSAFARSIDAASALLERLAAERPGDRVVIVRASRPERSWFVADPIGRNGAEARDKLSGVKCSFRRVATADVIRRFTDAFLTEAEEGTDRVVYFCTDFRRNDWSKAAKSGETLKQAMQEKAVWVLLDAAAGPEENLSILKVDTHPPIPVAGLDFEFVVTIANRGTQSLRDVKVDVEVDGSRLPRRELAELAAGAEGRIVVPAPPLDSAGWKAVTVKLPSDRLRADNDHHLALQVKRGVAVLIVDGDGSAGLEQQESFYLTRALAPRGLHRSGIAPDVLSPAQFQQRWDLSGYDLILIANYVPDAAKIEALEKYVDAGGSVGWLLGDRVEAREANRLIYKAGKGLLPLEIGDPEDLRAAGGGETDPVNFVPQVDGDPLRIFAGKTNPLRRQVHIYRAFKVEAPDSPPPATEILCRYTDAEGHVAMATKSVGQGKSFLLTTSIDLSWGDWPKDASYLVFVHHLVAYMTSHRGGAPIFRPGGSLELLLDPTQYTPKAGFSVPGAKPVELIAEKRDDAEGLWIRHAVGETPGIAKVDVTPISGGGGEDATSPQTQIWRAINADPEEGRLSRIKAEALRGQLPDTGYELVRLSDGADQLMETLVGEKREIWFLLMCILLAILITESTLAFLFGRGR